MFLTQVVIEIEPFPYNMTRLGDYWDSGTIVIMERSFDKGYTLRRN